MNYILIPLLVVLMVMTAVSLVRGIAAFLQGAKLDLESPESTKAMQIRQNKMMFARIKYQGLAVLVVALMLAMAR
jgi:hypothetical protein